MDIKPIETVYKGYRFRSRLEARWAVFFDAVGIAWEYEPEGFELSDGTRYLPDFYLPESRVWVEVKPDRPGIAGDILRAVKAIEADGSPITRLAILSEIPNAQAGDGVWHFPLIYKTHNETLDGEASVTDCFFIDEGGEDGETPELRLTHLPGWRRPFFSIWGLKSYAENPENARGLFPVHDEGRVPITPRPDEERREDPRRACQFIIHEDGEGFPLWLAMGQAEAAALSRILKTAKVRHQVLRFDPGAFYTPDEPKVNAAFQKARQARFEHGENPG